MNGFKILAALLLLLAALYLLTIGWTDPPASDGASANPLAPPAAQGVERTEQVERAPAPQPSADDVTAIRVLDAETAAPIPTATGCRAPRGSRLRIVTDEDVRADDAGLLSLGDLAPDALLVGAPGYASRGVAIERGRTVDVRLRRLRSAAIH